MGDDEKSPGMTVRIPVPGVLSPEAATGTLDPQTSDVLRALQRAKGTIVKTKLPTGFPSAADLADELRALREALATPTPVTEETAQSLASSARAFERAVVVPSEKLADFQRSHESAVRDLHESAHGLKRQVDVLAAWQAWWTRQVAVWGLVLALLFVAGILLAWRAHALARSTYDILEQILENQTKAPVGKGAKR
jgi:hypothetical protein